MNAFVGPHGISSDYGWFHVYSFTMFCGIAVSIIVSWYKMYRHKVPTDGLSLSVVFIIPAALFGASFIGKDDPLKPMSFWSKLAFWQGGLSIHGGVLFGVIAGIIFFGIISRKTKVSMWSYGDCIIPNILLGQVIGRWGNFFNHELLGDVIGYSNSLDASQIPGLSWLPAFIRDNCFKLSGGGPETDPVTGLYVFRAPIFLYESLANLGFWAILTFLVPKLFLWTSKKPWKVEPEKYQILTKQDIAKREFILNRQEERSFFTYALLVCKVKVINGKNFLVLWFKNQKVKRKIWRAAFYQQKASSLTIENVQQEYLTNHQTNKFYAYWHRSNQLYHLSNPHDYFVMRAGVQMWLYFFGWNLIRFCLELQRQDPADLFIINRRALDYGVLIGIFVIGLIMAILSQFVIARFFRKQGWTYEKEY